MLGVAPTGGFGRTDVGRRHAESFPEGVIEVGYVIEATCVGDAGYPVVAGEKLCPSQFQPSCSSMFEKLVPCSCSTFWIKRLDIFR